jgi:hypothetical protein
LLFWLHARLCCRFAWTLCKRCTLLFPVVAVDCCGCLHSQVTSEEEFEDRVQFRPMIDALVVHTNSEDRLTSETAMRWIHTFVRLGGNKLIVVLEKLITAVLRCLSASTVRPRVGCGRGPTLQCVGPSSRGRFVNARATIVCTWTRMPPGRFIVPL